MQQISYHLHVFSYTFLSQYCSFATSILHAKMRQVYINIQYISLSTGKIVLGFTFLTNFDVPTYAHLKEDTQSHDNLKLGFDGYCCQCGTRR